jgi:glycosyltransferase involved in cell wall biosynthesis
MPRQRLKVAFIVTEVAGVSFYRVAQPARYLESQRHTVKVLGYSKDAFIRPEWENLDGVRYGDIVRGDIFHACRWADVVVWMALHTSESFNLFAELRRKFANKPFVTEFDDIVFSIPAHNIASTVYYPGSPLTAISYSQIKLSDALIVSTPGLKEQLSEYNSDIHVVENAINLPLWRKSHPSPGRRRVTIGWVGGGTHTEDLATVKDVIFEVLAKNKNVVFRCVHGCPEFFKHKTDCPWLNTNDPRYDKARVCPRCGGIDRIEWTHDFYSIEKYPKWVNRQKFDIGIAPLEDNNFNRAKSNLRWLEYSALGIPTVASNIGHFKETVRHGETGFLVNDSNEWISALEKLIQDEDLRRSIGKAAQEEVKKFWSPQCLGRKFKQTLRGIHNAAVDKKRPRHADQDADRRSVGGQVHGQPGTGRDTESPGVVCS